MVWCASTEIFISPGPAHWTLEAFEKAIDANDPTIAPSMLYAYAAIMERRAVRQRRAEPHLRLPRHGAARQEQGRPDRREGLQDRPDAWSRPCSSPMFKARMLGVAGWYSTNILGNRDGEVLDDPESFKTKEESKLGVLEYILQPQLYPELYGKMYPQGADQLLSAPRRQQGGLGQHRHLRVAGLPDADQGRLPLPRLDPGRAAGARPGAVLRPRAAGRDSAASRSGSPSTSRARRWRRACTPSTTSSSSRPSSRTRLRYLMGEEQITHLGIEYYLEDMSVNGTVHRTTMKYFHRTRVARPVWRRGRFFGATAGAGRGAAPPPAVRRHHRPDHADRAGRKAAITPWSRSRPTRWGRARPTSWPSGFSPWCTRWRSRTTVRSAPTDFSRLHLMAV